MKKLVGLILLSLHGMTATAQAPVILFHEDFELPGQDDSVVSSMSVPGVKDWILNSHVQSQGIYSDSAQVKTGTTEHLTAISFSTAGYHGIKLHFDHICKIDLFDIATLDVSDDGGLTWAQLSGSQYLGSGNYATAGNRFNSNSYPNLWMPTNPVAVPQNTWWKSELFDISVFAANTADVKVRFKLTDAGVPGPNANCGWFLDHIRVTGIPLYPAVVEPCVNQTYCQDFIKLPLLAKNLYEIMEFHLELSLQPASLLAGFATPDSLPYGTISVSSNGMSVEIDYQSYPPFNILQDTLLYLYFYFGPGQYQLTWNTANCYFINDMAQQIPASFIEDVLTVSNCPQIGGYMFYDNTIQSPISGSTVNLYSGINIISQAATQQNGQYTLPPVLAGTFDLKATTTKPWGGVNISDALLIMKHVVGMINLAGMKLQAADVNNDGMVTAADPLLILYRFVGNISSFPAGDWIIQSFTLSPLPGATITQNIKAICTGDVNVSYIP